MHAALSATRRSASPAPRPIASEYQYLHRDLILFTYLHLAADRHLTDALLESGTTGIAYETVETEDRKLPLLMPMSEVAGRMATQVATSLGFDATDTGRVAIVATELATNLIKHGGGGRRNPCASARY